MATSFNEPSMSGWLLTILPRFPAFFSMFGSAMIISSVLRSKKNRRHMQQRLICAMSCFDFVASTVWFLNIYFIPPSFEAKGFPIALGNDISCGVQGFIIQLYTASFMYNVSLSTYYLLMINYNWGRTKISEIEKYFHLLPISFGLITAIIAVSLGKIGMADWDCWIEPKYGGLQWGFFFGPLVVSLSITLFNLLQVYLAIKKAESDSNARRMSNSGNQTIQVARQNQLYVISFAISWVLPTIARFIQLFGVTLPDWFVVACGTVIPSQGFFNALVYFRLRYYKCGVEHANKPWWWLVCRIISLTIFPCCLKDDHNVHDGRDLEHDSDTNNAERTIDHRTPSGNKTSTTMISVAEVPMDEKACVNKFGVFPATDHDGIMEEGAGESAINP